jgi:hypothetical protein
MSGSVTSTKLPITRMRAPRQPLFVGNPLQKIRELPSFLVCKRGQRRP